jgi:hypothetical protein
MMNDRVLRSGKIAPEHWCKSSYSGTAGNCIEVAELDCGSRAIRDSKDSTGSALTFTVDEWSAFTARICAGEFD